MPRTLVLFFCLVLPFYALAQDNKSKEKCPVSFFKVTPSDFNVDFNNLDTTSGAIVLADVGTSAFVGNNDGWFSIQFTRKKRIYIYKQSAYGIATIKLPYFYNANGPGKDKIHDIKATTYNLFNGEVQEFKLDEKNIFDEVESSNFHTKKFTLPSLKEGCIIDYTYTFEQSSIFSLVPWEFQGAYPRKWSEYTVEVPDFFEYVFLTQGYNPFYIQSNESLYKKYVVKVTSDVGRVSELYDVSSTVMAHRWVMKDVPALKEEPFTSTTDNYISKIEFQLSAKNFKGEPYVKIMGDWETVCNKLKTNPNFGTQLYEGNGWLREEIKTIVKGSSSDMEKAKRVYEFVRDNYVWEGDQDIYLSKSLKETFKSKSGATADLNLLLVAMLRRLDMDAKPVLLSTRSNGFVGYIYPLINKFNYVVCRLVINQVEYYLDASHPYNGFGTLPNYCYNGHARLIGDISVPITLYPDSIKETQLTSVTLFNDEKHPGQWSGNQATTFGQVGSYKIREKIATTGMDKYEQSLKDEYTGDWSIEDISLDQLKEYEKPVILNYSVICKGAENASLIYVNPMLEEGLKDNYFKQADRKYPVEIPYLMDETYVFKIEIPAGYTIDDMPQSAKVSLNEDEGFFEYSIDKSATEINLRSRIKLNKGYFLPEDYESIRNFFAFVAKKHAEQIVFKKL